MNRQILIFLIFLVYGNLFRSFSSFSQNSSDTLNKLIDQYNMHINAGETRKALNILNRMITIDTANDKYYYTRAMICSSPEINKTDSAIADLDAAIKINDTSVIYHFKRGMLIWDKNPESARMEFERTIQLDSDFYDGYEKLHIYYIDQNTLKAAKVRIIAQAHFLKRVMADSTNARYWFLLGKAYDLLYWKIELKSIQDKCFLAYSKAISLDSNVAEYYWERGTKNYFVKHDYDACIRDMTHAIRLDSSNYYYYLYISECYEEKGNFKQALEVVNQAIILFPDEWQLTDQKKELLKKMKNH